MGINYDDDELDKTPTHLLGFCLLGFIPTTIIIIIGVIIIVIITIIVIVIFIIITRRSAGLRPADF